VRVAGLNGSESDIIFRRTRSWNYGQSGPSDGRVVIVGAVPHCSTFLSLSTRGTCRVSLGGGFNGACYWPRTLRILWSWGAWPPNSDDSLSAAFRTDADQPLWVYQGCMPSSPLRRRAATPW